MKKTLSIIILSLITSAFLHAQTKDLKYQVFAGTDYPGFASFTTANNVSSTIPFHIGAKYYINEKMSVGLIYDRSSAQSKDIVFTAYTWNRTFTYNCILATFDYSWKRTDKYNLYSGIGIGNQDESYTTTITKGTGTPAPEKLVNNGFAIQLVFIGIHHKIGSSKFGYYGQLAWPVNGFINAGISYNIR